MLVDVARKREIDSNPEVTLVQLKIDALKEERDTIERKSKIKSNTKERIEKYRKLSKANDVYAHCIQ